MPLPPTPSTSKPFRLLTKSELMKNGDDNKFINAFLRKNGLMERILGYKMKQGRVESYDVMRHIIDLDNCLIEEYEVIFYLISID